MALAATVLSAGLPAASCKMVLAYYADWNKPAYSAAKIPFSKLTHICHAFAIPNADGSIGYDGGYLEPALISGAHAAGVKVLTSIGGANGSGNFANIAANLRQPFADNVRDFILANGYDGVDIDWEFPSNAGDTSNFSLLMQALRSTFNAAGHPEWLISGAFSADLWQVSFYDLAALKNSVSFFNVMTYDYSGPWSSSMGHNAPLGQTTGDAQANHNTQASINYYLGKGVPASQLVFGLPFYGYDFPTEDLNNACPGNNCSATTYVGYLAAAADVGNGWTRTWDASASSPYLRNNTGAGSITYDDPQSIQAKSAWALNTANLGGVFMWELSGDFTAPASQPLLDAMRAPLACGPTATPTLTPTPVIIPVPGRIQAEDYSISYDDTAGNAGGAYRTGDTDIEATTDAGGGYDVGYVDAGEWLEYQVLVSAAGTYDVTFRVASAQTTAMNLSLVWDGAALGGSVGISGTGGWQAWGDVTVTGLALSAGRHTLRVQLGTGGFNLDYIDVSREASPTPTRSPTSARSATVIATKTATPSASVTRSPTGSSTPGSTATPTRSSTAGHSPSATVSGSGTPSPSVTASPTLTASTSPSSTTSPAPPQTATPSPSPCATVTAALPSFTPTKSASALPSGSATPTASSTATPSAPVPSASSTHTPRPAPSHTAEASASPGAPHLGPLRIERVYPVPNPNPRALSLKLSGAVDEIELRIYSSANALLAVQSSGPAPLGWATVPLPGSFLQGAANGAYFYRVTAHRGAESSQACVGILFRSR